MELRLPALALFAAIGCAAGCKGNQEDMRSNSVANDPAQVAADNTAKNERDRSPTAVTPGDQSGSEADRNITQQIRQGVVGHDDISVTGKNVKIVTDDGVVTLRGPVATAEEKAEIAKIVKQVDGVKRVDNQLEIAAK